MKTCTKCGIEKPLSEYSSQGPRLRAACKLCCNEANIVWRAVNKDKIGTAPRTEVIMNDEGYCFCYECETFYIPKDRRTKCNRCIHLNKNYNLSWNEFQALIQLQDNCCAICHREFDGIDVQMRIDHDHSCCPTTKTCGACIRGLLCISCNTAIGLLQDDMEIMEKAIKYISSGLIK